jgi:DNA-damage-inducible protein J
MATSMLHVRIDDELKAKAVQALDAIGLSTADAVRLLFHRIVAEQAFPLELKVPNAETRAAMEESRQMMADIKAGRVQPFKSAEDMFASLERGE